MWKFCLFLLCCLVTSDATFNKYERLKEVFEHIKTNETLLQMFKEHEHQYMIAREKHLKETHHTRSLHPFQCHSGYEPSTFLPLSVHDLRPEHISVVAAMGDSITAGNGILGRNILDCLTEYRGRSWSMGGDLNFEQGVETLPNMLRKFNPNLKGYSIGKCDTSNLGCSQLNLAVAGETSQEMPRQANDLIRRLKDPAFGVDYHGDWKVITLFIGGNDLCDYCNNRIKYEPANYIGKIREALDTLHAEVPRAFVNLVQVLDITPLAEVAQGFFCNFVTNMVCDCPKDVTLHTELKAISRQYQAEITKLVSSGRYDTRDDFTVVLQPFFQEMKPPTDSTGKFDLAYFAPDCFHFSDLGANAAGKSLWNNMLEPVGAKRTEWHMDQGFHCPAPTSTSNQGVFRTTRN